MKSGMIIGAALTALCLIADGASAQGVQSTQPPATPPAQPGSPQTIPEKTPSSPGTGTVSDKLQKSDGVLKPPDMDPAMSKPAPSTGGSMPVIAPPEEKGGPVAK